MAVSTGYSSIVKRGLVFAIDTGDRNSHKGQPTTNFAPGWDPWTVNGINTNVSNTSDHGPVKNSITWKFQKTGSSNQWNGWESTYGGVWTGNAGDIWTTSYWYKTTQPAGINGFGIGYFYLPDWSAPYNTSILANVSSIIPDGEWHYNYTVTQFNQNYSNAIIVDGPSWGYSNQAGTLFINGLQWEKTTYPSPYTDGVRAPYSSESLGSLVYYPDNTVAMDVSTCSYINGKPYFDGTNDYVDIDWNAILEGSGPFTIESITNKVSGSYGAIIGNYGPGSDELWWSTAGLYLRGALYHSNYSVSMAGWHHSAVTRDASGNCKLYRDGELVGSANLSHSIAANAYNWRIGADVNGAGEPFTGEIPVIKVHNVELTEGEIKKNYLRYKTRFNLP
jgi:hypothetical protein